LPLPVAEPAPSEEGDVVPLDDDKVINVYNVSFDEFQKNIVQVERNHFLDDHASPTFFRERVIVVDTRKNLNSIVEDNLAFTGESRSNIQDLMTRNEKLEQNLQASRKDVQQIHTAKKKCSFHTGLLGGDESSDTF